MPYTFTFTNKAKKEFLKLESNVQRLIRIKLTTLKNQPDLVQKTKTVQDLLPATHRLRISNYRLLINFEKEKVIIYRVGHRREVYKKKL